MCSSKRKGNGITMSTKLLCCFMVVHMFMSSSPVLATVEEDFKYFLTILPGIFDNSLQVLEDMAKQLPPDIAHFRVTAKIFAQEVPIFPSNVKTFYLQEFVYADPQDIVRQKIYAFQISQTTQEIILKFYSFVNPTKFINAQDNPSLFKNLTQNDIMYLPGCDVKWTRVEQDLFRSAGLEKCQIVYNNVSIYITDTNDLTPSYLTVNEKWMYVSNGSIYRTGTPYNMTKQIVSGNKPTLSPNGAVRNQLNNFTEIIGALQHSLPVSLFIDLPNCHLGKVLHDYSNDSKSRDDFSTEGFSVDIDTFDFFNSSVFAAYPYFVFSYAPIVRTSKGELYQLYEGRVSDFGMFITITWLNATNYKRAQQFIYECQLRDATKGNGGQMLAVSSQVSLEKVTNFDQLKKAVQQGYNFRFYVSYIKCEQGPHVNAFAGGIIQGIKLGYNGNSVSFSKSELTSNNQGEGYVTNIVSGTISRDGFVATLETSDDTVLTFKRVYIEKFVCSVSTADTQGALELYYY